MGNPVADMELARERMAKAFHPFQKNLLPPWLWHPPHAWAGA
jgi:hypothetical protein